MGKKKSIEYQFFPISLYLYQILIKCMEEMILALVILRHSIGFQQEFCSLSLLDFRKETNMSENTIVKYLKILENKGIIIINKIFKGKKKFASQYQISKNILNMNQVSKKQVITSPVEVLNEINTSPVEVHNTSPDEVLIYIDRYSIEKKEKEKSPALDRSPKGSRANPEKDKVIENNLIYFNAEYSKQPDVYKFFEVKPKYIKHKQISSKEISLDLPFETFVNQLRNLVEMSINT